MGFLKKGEPLGCHQPIADIGDYTPGGEMCWCGVNFPRDLKCQILSSLTVEIAFKGAVRSYYKVFSDWIGTGFDTV